MALHRVALTALSIVGVFMSTSSVISPPHKPALLAMGVPGAARSAESEQMDSSPTVGLVPAETLPPIRPHMAPAADPAALISRPPAAASANTAAATSQPSVRGIPEIVLGAYRNSELSLARSQPDCGLPWNLLAGIGRIESGHAGGGNVDAHGTTVTPILGPALDGTLAGNEVIADGRGGFVRAVGPMQFLPGTWVLWGADGDGDGYADPNNVFDAALAAGRYLCAGGANLRDPDQQLPAVLRYNNSRSYASDVLRWSASYGGGGVVALPSAIPAPIPFPQPDTDQPNPATTEPSPESEHETQPQPRTESEPDSPARQQPMIVIPGLPPIPCGILCSPSAG
ncbi:lytic transglycosylase domain-containing protein [Nocardia niigatensis]|uniref:lytic transglycosylase domain-containing protein n=1 Tax=Nocardia niigatensis TaxID=209249 RepID=UPI00030D53B3|nr:lytic murein transglycosylase [Nocardia niigatensis]